MTSNLGTNVALTYSRRGADASVIPSSPFTTWDAFFQNTDTTNCPITSCSLYDSGSCGTGAYSGAAEVSMDASSPWGITASVTETAGYSWPTCVRCSNGA